MGKYKTFFAERRPLHELLPASHPLSISININNKCNFSCKFCLRSRLSIGDEKKMPLNLFKKIIADLSDFKEPVVIAFGTGPAEPLLNPQFPEFIKIAKNCKKVKHLTTNTNAYMLTPELSRDIISAGLDNFIISIYGMSGEHYKSVVSRDVDFNRIKDNVAYLYSIKGNTHIHIKCIGDYFSDEQKEEFLSTFSPFSDSINIEKVVNQWIGLKLDKKASINKYSVLFAESPSICSRAFYRLYINLDGKVGACYNSTVMENGVFEDVNKISLKDIWAGKMICDMRMAFLLGNYKEKYPVCSECEFTGAQRSEDLTPYREELIEKYNEYYSQNL